LICWMEEEEEVWISDWRDWKTEYAEREEMTTIERRRTVATMFSWPERMISPCIRLANL